MIDEGLSEVDRPITQSWVLVTLSSCLNKDRCHGQIPSVLG